MGGNEGLFSGVLKLTVVWLGNSGRTQRFGRQMLPTVAPTGTPSKTAERPTFTAGTELEP